jgi:hypothetical protein
MELNRDCRLSFVEERGSDGSPYPVSELTYDAEGRITSARWESKITLFSYEDDLLTEVCSNDSFTGWDNCHYFFYDPEKRLFSATLTGALTNDGYEINKYYYHHYPDSIVVKDSLDKRIEKYYMLNNGRPSRYESYSDMFGISYWSEYDYDEHGNRVGFRFWGAARSTTVEHTYTFDLNRRHVQDDYWIGALIQNLLFPQNTHAVCSYTTTGGTVNLREDYRYSDVSESRVEVYRTISYLGYMGDPSEEHFLKGYVFTCN